MSPNKVTGEHGGVQQKVQFKKKYHYSFVEIYTNCVVGSTWVPHINRELYNLSFPFHIMS